jgi:hypothetical protein
MAPAMMPQPAAAEDVPVGADDVASDGTAGQPDRSTTEDHERRTEEQDELADLRAPVEPERATTVGPEPQVTPLPIGSPCTGRRERSPRS